MPVPATISHGRMTDFLIGHYNLIKALHVIAVIAWMAGIMYLPRLYAYHTKHGAGTEIGTIFDGMEQKLLRIIMGPAMGIAFIFGGTLLYIDGASRGWSVLGQPWMVTKLVGVVFMLVWHSFLARSQVKVATGTSKHSEKFWRATNELPFLAAIVMVIAVMTEFGAG